MMCSGSFEALGLWESIQTLQSSIGPACDEEHNNDRKWKTWKNNRAQMIDTEAQSALNWADNASIDWLGACGSIELLYEVIGALMGTGIRG